MTDPFAATRAVYASAAGAAAYIGKEQRTMEARNASAWDMVNGLDLHGKRVLDLGCGFGRDVIEFRRRGAEAFGLDASPALLAEARRQSGQAGWWFAGELESLQEPPVAGPFDIIWFYAVLLHLPREAVPGLLARWAGWLKPGGLLLLATQEGDGEKTATNMGEDFSRHMVFWREAELLALAARVGLAAEWVGTLVPKGQYNNPLLQVRLCRA